jgi:sec-independent protein translocase protein TatB
VFGLSLTELVVIAVVTLVAVGPQRLPGMLKTLGEWIRKLRRMTTEVRAQTGIDDILRAEGIHGGLNELRGLVRGQFNEPPRRGAAPADPYNSGIDTDPTREYPLEGADAAGALPDDLFDEPLKAPELPSAPVTGSVTP